MQIKQLERATKILQYIKELDAEIVQIEAFAMQAANDDIEIKLRLDTVDLNKKTEEDNKVKFDTDVPLNVSRFVSHMMFGYVGVVDEKKEKSSKTEYTRDISNTSALQILGVLLFELQNKRMQFIRKLEAIGVTL